MPDSSGTGPNMFVFEVIPVTFRAMSDSKLHANNNIMAKLNHYFTVKFVVWFR